MKVVLDTNVLVSGIFWGGKPAEIIDAFVEGKFELITSSAILSEYVEVISRISKKHFADNSNFLIDHWSFFLTDQSTIIQPKHKILLKTREPGHVKLQSYADVGENSTCR